MKTYFRFFVLMLTMSVIFGCAGKEQYSSTLSLTQKNIIIIAAYTANGDQNKLKKALNTALDDHLTINAIKEILVQMYAYTGFPRSLNAINTFSLVLQERQKHGMIDAMGNEEIPMPSSINKNAYGTYIRNMLLNRTDEPSPTGYQLFVPVIDQFLKEHLFADIFWRNKNLDLLSRELATVGALSALKGTEPQLIAHFGIVLHVGLTEQQAKDVIIVLKKTLGQTAASQAATALHQALKDRQSS